MQHGDVPTYAHMQRAHPPPQKTPRSGTRIRLVAATSSTREVHRKAHHLEAKHSRTFMSSKTTKIFSVSKSTM